MVRGAEDKEEYILVKEEHDSASLVGLVTVRVLWWFWDMTVSRSVRPCDTNSQWTSGLIRTVTFQLSIIHSFILHVCSTSCT